MRIRSIGRYLDRIAEWSPTCARDNHVVDVSADEYRTPSIKYCDERSSSCRRIFYGHKRSESGPGETATGDNLMMHHPIHRRIAIAGGIFRESLEITSACICRLELFSLSLLLRFAFSIEACHLGRWLILGECWILYR
jgi:hypothetical protein